MQNDLFELLKVNTEVLKKQTHLIEILASHIEDIEQKQKDILVILNQNTCFICKKIRHDKSQCVDVCKECFQKL